jgi:hypothetical protein
MSNSRLTLAYRVRREAPTGLAEKHLPIRALGKKIYIMQGSVCVVKAEGKVL